MKPSDIMKLAMNASELASHAHTLQAIISSVIGKDPPSAEETSAHKKGWGGVFGYADEAGIVNLLAKLAKSDSAGRDVFVRFMAKKFPKGKTWSERASYIRSSNAFRNFVVGLGETPSHQYKVKETPIKVGNKTEYETEYGKEPAINHSLEFIERCIEIIRSGKTEARGYNLLMKELQALNVPTQNKELSGVVESISTNLRTQTEQVSGWLESENQRLESSRGLVRRLLDRFL